jgi:hypothetical protein
MRIASLVPALLVALGAALVTAAARAQEEAAMRPFPQAVEALADAVRKAAPDGVTVTLEEATPAVLGWRASREGAPARVLTIMARSGVSRSYGLLPAEGEYTPLPDRPALVVTVGPDLAVVQAAGHGHAAATLDAVEAARPLLDRAAAPIDAWEAEEAGRQVEAKTFVTGAVERVVVHPHYVALDVAHGGSVDRSAAWRAGQRALVWRVLASDGAFVAPTISFAPR